MRIALFFFIVFTIPVLAFPATIKVPGDYPAIQQAIDAAVNGDAILVAPGTYVENIDFHGKAITVMSDKGPEVTVIDGHQAWRVATFKSGESASSVLDGFTVTNGDSGIFCMDDSSPTITNNNIMENTHQYFGCGIYCQESTPVITNNTISRNTADDYGGGIYCWASSPTIVNNTISENTAAVHAAGIYCLYSSPTIANNTISGNTAQYDGGGIYCYDSFPIITNNTITGNSAYFGGGIYCEYASAPTIMKNNIMANSANVGGGIYCYYSSPTIMNNTITGNSASSGAGGIFCADASSPTIMNNIITGNAVDFYGGGIYCYKSANPTITNNTVNGNSADRGGGIYCWYNCSPTIINTILWDNSAPTGPEIWLGDTALPSTLTISYSDVKGGQASVHVDPNCTLNWGSGMIDADPLFMDPTNSDFHLTFPSPCKDNGDNAAALDLYDFEGDPRIAYGTVDIGADEFYTHLYWTGDATPGGNVEVKFVGLPGTSPVGLCIGTGVLNPPLKSMWGDWYLKFPILGPVSMPSIPTTGVLIIPGTIPGSPPAPYSIPMQALIGAELTNLSVLVVK